MAEVQIQPQTPPKTVRIPSRTAKQAPVPQILDLVCVGFGSIGLGLAVALQDTDFSQSNVVFLEQNAAFVADVNASQDGTPKHLSSSFAHDLATLRNPTSKFTYLNYLCEKGNLDAVVGAEGSPFPERAEFAGYLTWAAAQLGQLVRYGKAVTDVRSVEVGGLGKGVGLWAITVFDVESGRNEVLAARNVVFAQGREATFANVQVSAGMKSQQETLGDAVDMVRNMCKGNQTEVSIEDKLENLASYSSRVLKTCFEGDVVFSRRAVL